MIPGERRHVVFPRQAPISYRAQEEIATVLSDYGRKPAEMWQRAAQDGPGGSCRRVWLTAPRGTIDKRRRWRRRDNRLWGRDAAGQDLCGAERGRRRWGVCGRAGGARRRDLAVRPALRSVDLGGGLPRGRSRIAGIARAPRLS